MQKLRASAMVGTLKSRYDENEAQKFNKEKKYGVTSIMENNTTTKRSAFIDLKNRVAVNAANAKDAAQKDLKDAKPAIRNPKARANTWKKAPLGTATNGATAQPTNIAVPTVAAVGRKVLTRSKSVRLPTNAPIAAATTVTSGLALQRQRSNDLLLVGHAKPKTVTAKVVESKVQQVKFINKTNKAPQPEEKKPTVVEGALRREDSNLSRKSLTKLKAALSRDSSKSLAKTNSGSALLLVKKEDQKKPETIEQKLISQNSSSDIKIVNARTHSSKLLDVVENIDANDAENLVLVSEYVNDIYNYLFNLEIEHAIRHNHLQGQVEVSAKMRAVLIDWINEVHLQFHLAGETFQMAVAILDRYLQTVKDTKRQHLQLVGVTALFMAAKYEELFPPAIADFVYITDDTYTTQQIVQMELKIFKALDCNLARPLPIHFLRRFSKAANAEDVHHAMSKYFLELTSVEYDLAAYKPSEIAAASLFLSLHLLKDDAKVPSGFSCNHWSPTLEWYSRYSAEHLRPLTLKIAALATNAPSAKLKAVYNKYTSSKFQKISMRPELYSVLIGSIINSTQCE